MIPMIVKLYVDETSADNRNRYVLLQVGNIIVVLQYDSKYVDIARLNDIDETFVIIHPKSSFECHGITNTFVSDNGPPYATHGFMHFVER